MDEKSVGFIGLGAMGSNSARRLVQQGYRVQGFDVRKEARDELGRAGGSACPTAADAARGVPAVVLFVVNGAQAEEVLFGPGGVAQAGTTALDVLSCVTMSPSDAAALGKRCAERGWGFVDSPVSGGVKGAAAGTLSIMAAGADDTFARCRAIYDAMGSRVTHVGLQPGQGSMVKTINQLLCGVHIAVAGEAMALADRAGLDLQAVWDVVNFSAAGSWMLNDRGPRMIARSFDTPVSAVDIFVKDLGIVLDVARDLHFPTPLAATALQSFLGASGAGNGKRDDSAVMLYFGGFQPPSG